MTSSCCPTSYIAQICGWFSADAARASIDSLAASHEARHAPLLAVLGMLHSAAAKAPLLVLVDDVDIATHSVREAIRFLTAGLGAVPMGWVIVDTTSTVSDALRIAPVNEAGARATIASMLPGIDGAEVLARLALERGSLDAFIWASPGRFLVETPSAVAVEETRTRRVKPARVSDRTLPSSSRA